MTAKVVTTCSKKQYVDSKIEVEAYLKGLMKVTEPKKKKSTANKTVKTRSIQNKPL